MEKNWNIFVAAHVCGLTKTLHNFFKQQTSEKDISSSLIEYGKCQSHQAFYFCLYFKFRKKNSSQHTIGYQSFEASIPGNH